MVLTIYKLDASPPVRAVLMTIEQLSIQDVEYVDVNLLSADHMKDDYLKINPQHTVPAMIDDNFAIWDSHVICTYLVGKYAPDSGLYPTDLKKRAVVDQRLHFDSGILFPALRGTLEPILFRGETSYRPENLERIQKAYGLSEKLFTSDWLAGDEITLADFCCVASISSLNEVVPIDENIYPNLAAWLERCSTLEVYKKANTPGLTQLRARIQSKLS